MCGHEFCRDCLVDYLTMKISEKAIPIPCPFNGCTSNVSESDLHLLIEPKLMEKYEKFMLSNFIETNANDFSCCPTPNCPYLFYYEPGDFDFKCPKCTKRYCLNCKVDYHVKSTCKMYQQWCVQNGQADDLFTNFVRGNKLKQCFKCKKFVQKVSGCNHITCTCGAQFCYVCGNKYPCKKNVSLIMEMKRIVIVIARLVIVMMIVIAMMKAVTDLATYLFPTKFIAEWISQLSSVYSRQSSNMINEFCYSFISSS